MFEKVLIWFSKLSTLAKSILAIIAFCTAIWGLKVGYDRIIINKHDREQIEIKRWSKVDRLIASDSIQGVKIDALLENQIDMSQQQYMNTNSINALTKLVTREFAKIMTPEEVLDMVNDLEVKKNENNLLPTVLKQNK